MNHTVNISTLDCEQSLFCSKIRGKERKTRKHASVTASVTCEPRVVRASEYERRYLRLASSHVTLARSRPLACVVFFFAFFPKDFRAKARLLTVYFAQCYFHFRNKKILGSGTHFSNFPESFRARKAIFSSSVSKRRNVHA